MYEFEFNLLLPKSEEEINKEKKRDLVSVYYSLLPLSGIIVWLGLLLFNTFFLSAKRTDLEDVITDKQNTIEVDYFDIRKDHGELVIKTRTIAPLLARDIDPEIVFLVAEQVFPQESSNVKIVGYGRNDDGSFAISIETSNYRLVAENARKLKNLELISALNVDVASNDTGSTLATYNFEIDVEYLNQQLGNGQQPTS